MNGVSTRKGNATGLASTWMFVTPGELSKVSRLDAKEHGAPLPTVSVIVTPARIGVRPPLGLSTLFTEMAEYGRLAEKISPLPIVKGGTTR